MVKWIALWCSDLKVSSSNPASAEKRKFFRSSVFRSVNTAAKGVNDESIVTKGVNNAVAQSIALWCRDQKVTSSAAREKFFVVRHFRANKNVNTKAKGVDEAAAESRALWCRDLKVPSSNPASVERERNFSSFGVFEGIKP